MAAHRFLYSNGLRFHTVQQGEGPPVLLLHGFPEFWYSWRHQLPALAERFRAVAPDLRGYNLTDRPGGGYVLPNLVADVVGLIDALGVERARIVGHDWGGVLAWTVAMWAPERVEKLAILNAPHFGAYFRELRGGWAQRLKSWYVLFFQARGLAEWALTRGDCRAIVELLRDTGGDAFSDEDLERYRRVFARPGALSAALEYYRGIGRFGLGNVERSVRPITVPTLVVWGERDPALVPELTEGLEAWVPDLRVVRVPDAGHWIQQERPELVNRDLLAFL